MKIILLSSFFIFLFCGFINPSADQKAKRIIENYIEASGGAKNVLAVKTYKSKGNWYGDKKTWSYVNMSSFPNKQRGELRTKDYSEITIYNSGISESRVNDTETIEVTKQDVLNSYELDCYIFTLAYLDIIATKVEFVKESTLDGIKVEEIFIEYKNGARWNVQFNAQTHLMYNVVCSDGVEIKCKKYKKFGDVIFPTELDVNSNGQNLKLILDEIEYNIALDDSLFKIEGDENDNFYPSDIDIDDLEHIDVASVKVNGKLPIVNTSNALYRLLGKPDSVVKPGQDVCNSYYDEPFNYGYFDKSIVEIYGDTAVFTSLNFQGKTEIELSTPKIILNRTTTLKKLEKIFPVATKNKREVLIKDIGKTICVYLYTSEDSSSDYWCLYFLEGTLVRVDYWIPC